MADRWSSPVGRINNLDDLANTTFYNQVWVMDAKANTFGVGTNNGGKGVIGY